MKNSIGKKIIRIAKNDPKLTKISKLRSFNIFVLNKFLNKNKFQINEIGSGSVKPCNIPNRI